MLPTFIGIGAPKAGTTWLFKCLQEHPHIFIAQIKETHFFSFFYNVERLSEYEAHFNYTGDKAIVGELSTSYLSSVEAPERIQRHIPEVKLFASLRNPIEQVYSHYWHLRRQNFHTGDKNQWSFEEALQKYEDRLLKPALYSQHLQRWSQYFDRSQMLILFYDDIQAHPQQLVEKLYRFLGVETAFIPQSLRQSGISVRQGASPKNRIAGQLYATLYERLNLYVYTPLKTLLGEQQAALMKDALKVRQVLQTSFYKEGYPEMNPNTRLQLRNYFAGEITELENLTNCDLSHWQ